MECGRPCFGLLQEIVTLNGDQLGHQPLPGRRFAVHERFGFGKDLAAAPLNRITGEGERRTGKADQRNIAPGQLVDDELDRFQGRPHALFRGWSCQHVNVIGALDRVVDRRPLAFDEIELQAHPNQHRQNVGEDDPRIQSKGVERLHGYLGGEFRRGDHFEHRMFGPDRPVLCHITPGLAHQPDRRVLGW